MVKLQGEIEIPVWNFTQINQEWGQIAYFDYPISADSSPNTGPKNPEVVSKVRSMVGSTVYAVWKSPTSSRAAQSEIVHCLLLAVI